MRERERERETEREKGTYVLGNGCEELLPRELVFRAAMVIEVSARRKQMAPHLHSLSLSLALKPAPPFLVLSINLLLRLDLLSLLLSLSIRPVHVVPGKHLSRFVL